MGQEAILRMFIDNTDVVKAEELRAKENFQRMLLAYISHEFRTPLNALFSGLDIMI
jgi:signal transduction histidine kinase